ncbi:hypothetical protein LINPERPRIM_LOCUS7712 [Linum perenne]
MTPNAQLSVSQNQLLVKLAADGLIPLFCDPWVRASRTNL